MEPGIQPVAPAADTRLTIPEITPTTPQGQAMGPAVVVKNMDQLRAEEQAKSAQSEAATAKIQDQLAAHVDACFETAKRARKEIVIDGVSLDEMLLECMRRRRGEYAPQKLAQLREQGDPIIYDLTTQVKCGHAEAWLDDVYMRDALFTLSPSSEPELPEGIIQEVIRQTMQAVVQDIQAGMQPMNPGEIMQYAGTMSAHMKQAYLEDAKKRAGLMEKRIIDFMQEGGFDNTFSEFRSNLVTFGTGILEGPLFEYQNKLTWVNGDPVVARKIVMKFRAVHPMDYFPAPHLQRGVQGGWRIQREYYEAAALSEMMNVPGVKVPALLDILKVYGISGHRLNVDTDFERRKLQDKSTTANQDGVLEGLKWDGKLLGEQLLQWQPTLALQGIKASSVYDVCLHKIGTYVWKVSFNYDPLQRTRYHEAAYENIPGSQWGRGVPWKMRDLQDRMNGAIRALCKNMALSAGPIKIVDIRFNPPGQSVKQSYPGQIIFIESKAGESGEAMKSAVRFEQVPSNAAELIGIYTQAKQECDERTGLPAYQFGSAEAATGGAATFGGLNLLMGASMRTIKRICGGIDKDALRPLVHYIFTSIMRYDPDKSIKGDVDIVVRGATGVMMKEQKAVQIAAWLAELKSNPVLAQAVGRERIVAAARELAEVTGLNVEKLLPSEEEVRQQMKAEMEMQIAMAQAGGPAGPGRKQLPAAAPQPEGAPT